MMLWLSWWKMVRQLRPAFSRETTFLWFALCLVGLSIRPDLRGVTSIIRALVPDFINTLTYFMLEVVNLLWHDDNQGGYPCQELAHIVSS